MGALVLGRGMRGEGSVQCFDTRSEYACRAVAFCLELTLELIV